MALTGYWVAGVCADTKARALDLLNSNPVSIYDYFTWTVYTDLAGANVNVKTNAFFPSNYTSSAWTVLNHTMTLGACDPSLSVSPVIDAVSILEVFGWGFGAVVLFFCFGYWIAVALQAIKKAG